MVKKVVFFVLLIILGVMVTLYGFHNLQESRTLAAEGKSTLAKVKNHYIQTRPGEKHYLAIEFQTENKQRQTHTMSVSKDVYQAAVASGSVTVHYLPAKPSRFQAGPKVQISYGVFVGGLAYLAATAVLFVIYRGRRRRTAQSLTSFCDHAQNELEKAGFVFMEDTNDGSGLFFRTLFHPDRATLAMLFRVASSSESNDRKKSHVVNFETAFDNGRYVITTNAENPGEVDHPDAIDPTWLPSGTGFQMVLAAHEKHLTTFQQKHPRAKPLPMKSAADVLRIRQELARINAEFNQQEGLTNAA